MWMCTAPMYAAIPVYARIGRPNAPSVLARCVEFAMCRVPLCVIIESAGGQSWKKRALYSLL